MSTAMRKAREGEFEFVDDPRMGHNLVRYQTGTGKWRTKGIQIDSFHPGVINDLRSRLEKRKDATIRFAALLNDQLQSMGSHIRARMETQPSDELSASLHLLSFDPAMSSEIFTGTHIYSTEFLRLLIAVEFQKFQEREGINTYEISYNNDGTIFWLRTI
jgi:hypothetical protein